MLYTQDRFEEIRHTALFEESKIKLAQSYKEDVKFLLSLLKQKQEEIDNLSYLKEGSEKIQIYLKFIDGINTLLREYNLTGSVPC